MQFHPIELYPEELGVTWEEISGAFTKQFVPRLQVRAAPLLQRCLLHGVALGARPGCEPPIMSPRPTLLACPILALIPLLPPLRPAPPPSPPPPQAAVKAAIKRASTLGAKISPVAAARISGEEGGGRPLASEGDAPARRRRSEKDDEDENAEVGGWARDGLPGVDCLAGSCLGPQAEQQRGSGRDESAEVGHQQRRLLACTVFQQSRTARRVPHRRRTSSTKGGQAALLHRPGT